MYHLPKSMWVTAGIVCAFACLRSPAASNEIINGDFETAMDQTLQAWSPTRQGYHIDRVVSHSGKQSIRCIATGDETGMGVVQTITYDKPDRRPVIITGWCRTQNAMGGGDCSIYVDGLYEDGTPWWGRQTLWKRGTHGWEYSAAVHYPAKPVKELQVFVFLRRTTGTAWFDDIALYRGGLHVTDVGVAWDYPRSRFGMRLEAKLTQKSEWTATLLDSTRETIATETGKGRDILWMWPGDSARVATTAVIAARNTTGETTEFPLEIAPPIRSENPVRSGYAVWTQDSMVKVYPTALPGKDDGGSIELAQGEHEGFQISVRPTDSLNLQDVVLDIGKLLNENGTAFPQANIKWHVVGYVWVQAPSGHPAGPPTPNWCPDPLLPAKPTAIPGGRTQTFWIDAHADKETPPGTYSGTMTVRPRNAPPTNIPVSVRVRSFTLPKTFNMKTAFAIMDGFTRRVYGEITPQLRRQCLDIMLDHRLNPDDISRTEPPRTEDLLYARDQGMNAFNILNLVPKPEKERLWTCYAPIEAYKPDFNQTLARRMDPIVRELRKYGLAEMAYVYGFDERREEYDDLIKGICKFVKERYPEISTFTTAGYMYAKRAETPPDYQDFMDWYCPLTPRYKMELSDALRSRGKQVWWYVCCGPKHPYANFAAMDYATIEGRLLPWMTFAEKADGLLFWHVNYWNRDAPVGGDDPYLLDWKPTCIAGMTGDGLLIYPMPDGPVSSIRLENIRDGVEDYDYLTILANLKGREAVLPYIRRQVQSTTQYSLDPQLLRQIRSEIADAVVDAWKD